MVFGTFDGLHEGHLNFFRQAREFGDYLIAVAGREKNIEKLKGKKPIRSEKERVGDLEKCELVDEARLGYENEPYKIVEELRPNVICLGYDQKHFAENLKSELEKMGLSNIKIYRLKPFEPEKYHSSIINKKYDK